jgi:hypothetical protein
MILPAHKLEVPVFQKTAIISRPVNDVVWVIAERVWNKNFSGQFGLVVIPMRAIGRTNENLANFARRTGVSVGNRLSQEADLVD